MEIVCRREIRGGTSAVAYSATRLSTYSSIRLHVASAIANIVKPGYKNIVGSKGYILIGGYSYRKCHVRLKSSNSNLTLKL